ncbi:MAG: hypothetical protein WCW13_02300 [archaeon]|jgi:hypothetical protein
MKQLRFKGLGNPEHKVQITSSRLIPSTLVKRALARKEIVPAALDSHFGGVHNIVVRKGKATIGFIAATDLPKIGICEVHGIYLGQAYRQGPLVVNMFRELVKRGKRKGIAQFVLPNCPTSKVIIERIGPALKQEYQIVETPKTIELKQKDGVLIQEDFMLRKLKAPIEVLGGHKQ